MIYNVLTQLLKIRATPDIGLFYTSEFTTKICSNLFLLPDFGSQKRQAIPFFKEQRKMQVRVVHRSHLGKCHCDELVISLRCPAYGLPLPQTVSIVSHHLPSCPRQGFQISGPPVQLPPLRQHYPKQEKRQSTRRPIGQSIFTLCSRLNGSLHKACPGPCEM